jgi:hypothetical protein
MSATTYIVNGHPVDVPARLTHKVLFIGQGKVCGGLDMLIYRGRIISVSLPDISGVRRIIVSVKGDVVWAVHDFAQAAFFCDHFPFPKPFRKQT